MERKRNSISNCQKKKLNLHAIRVKQTQFAIGWKNFNLQLKEKKTQFPIWQEKKSVCTE